MIEDLRNESRIIKLELNQLQSKYDKILKRIAYLESEERNKTQHKLFEND